MKFSMTGQERGDLLLQVTAWAGFDCTYKCITLYGKLFTLNNTYSIESGKYKQSETHTLAYFYLSTNVYSLVWTESYCRWLGFTSNLYM